MKTFAGHIFPGFLEIILSPLDFFLDGALILKQLIKRIVRIVFKSKIIQGFRS